MLQKLGKKRTIQKFVTKSLQRDKCQSNSVQIRLQLWTLKVILSSQLTYVSCWKLQINTGKGPTFFPGLTSLRATSAAVLAAARTSAARPVTGPSQSTCVCATTALKPSMWQPRSLQQTRKIFLCISYLDILKKSIVSCRHRTLTDSNDNLKQLISTTLSKWLYQCYTYNMKTHEHSCIDESLRYS